MKHIDFVNHFPLSLYFSFVVHLKNYVTSKNLCVDYINFEFHFKIVLEKGHWI